MTSSYKLPRPSPHASHIRIRYSKMFRPSKSQDWEPYREIIAALYEIMKLKDVMLEMQLSHGFKATEKQYKTQLKKWNLDTKYIKASEYLAMVKIKREREAANPSKQTQFVLRGRLVENKDITRFEKRASKKGTLQLDEDEDDEPVEDLRYETPPPEFQYPSVLYQATQYPAPGQYQEYQAYDGTHYTY
ncbi:Clr5 domain-containing protein [Schizothecium vesticola]|uniref:Clr5 domain-containing protein n=1 Tax=Schizothecium vesticola TaxID=314040 RepID=A0AA40EQ51_9PEZI|nr:Clr5 domain-containing protein [Schizothecium vesticola]